MGMNISLLRMNGFDCSVGAALFGGPIVGLLFPVTIGKDIFEDKIRLQTTATYRSGGEFNPGGGDTISASTISLGLGFAINKLLPAYHPHGTKPAK